MNRRAFLSFLGAGAGLAAIDPDRLLWEKGKKIFSIPKPSNLILSVGDVVEFEGFYAVNPLTRQIAVNPETGQPFHTRYVIVDYPDSSHPLVFPRMIPEGHYQNVAMPKGFNETNRPPRDFIRTGMEPRIPLPTVANLWGDR